MRFQYFEIFLGLLLIPLLIYVLISVDDMKTEGLVLEYGLQVVTEYELSIKWLAEFVDNGKKINSRIVNIG